MDVKRVFVIIDPSVNIQYASFYIFGLYELFGKDKIKFDASPFLFLPLHSRTMVLNFILVKNGVGRKVSINMNDPYQVLEENYSWCDIYGNVNANFNLTPIKYHEKLVSLAPSFGVKIWNLCDTFRYAIKNYHSVSGHTIETKKYLGKYRRLYIDRIPYIHYTPKNSIRSNYIFHISTLWYNDEWNENDKGVNLRRADFIRACKDLKDKIRFEGGLIPQNKNRSTVDVFYDVLFQRDIKIKEYIRKIQESVFVFNTPAFWNCHGWKLGEYLALGKAIISTPLSNDLPHPLTHGENIHFISSSNKEEISNAILTILNDINYRKKLEFGARKYWVTYGSPVMSLRLLGIN